MAFSISFGRRLGYGSFRSGQPVEEALGAGGLKVAADLVELLAGVSHDLAGLGYIVKFRGQFEETELASGDFDLSGL